MHLGINAVEGDDLDHFEPIILKGTPYPLDEPRKKIVRPAEPNQKLLRIPVYEGLNSQASLNELQGEIEIPLSAGLDRSQEIEITFDYDKNRVVTMTVRILGTNQVFQHRLVHARPRPRPDPNGGASRKDDWVEDAGSAVDTGKYFVQGYGMYMVDDERRELEEAIHRAATALEAKDEQAGRQAQLFIDNKIMSSGLASMMYIADRVLPRANDKQGRLLAKAIAGLRAAHRQGPDAQFDKLVQDVRLVVADIINDKFAVESMGGKDKRGLLEVFNQSPKFGK
jgi:molecular chaperone DnaK